MRPWSASAVRNLRLTNTLCLERARKNSSHGPQIKGLNKTPAEIREVHILTLNESEDRSLFGGCTSPQDRAHLPTIQRRNTEVQENDVRGEVGGGAQRLTRIANHSNIMPLKAQEGPQQLAAFNVIATDQQNPMPARN